MFSNKHNKIVKNIIICIAPLIPIAILLLSNKLQYYIVDDIHMNIYARGGFEKGFTRDTLFVNPILARIWKVLFAFNDNVDWMALTYLALIFICTIILIVVSNKYLKIWQSIILAYLFEIIILGWFTFTVIAYITSLFGIALFLIGWEREKNKILLIILGILFVDMGFLLRKDAFISSLILAVPYIVYSLRKRIGVNINKRTIITLLSTVLVICVVNIMFGQLVYNDTAIKKYKQWNDARSNVVDYHIPKYEDNKELYKKIGFSENDYLGMTYIGGYLADNNVYSYDNLETIVKNTPLNVRYNFNALSILKGMAKMEALWIFAIGWLLSLLMTSKRKLVVIQGIITAIMIVGLLFIDRCPERVHVPIFLVSFIILLIIALQYPNKISKFKKSYFVVGTTFLIGLCCLVSCFQLYQTNKSIEDAERKYESLSKFAENNKDKLFIFNSCAAVTRKEKMKIYSKKERYDNYTSLFGYELYSPMYYNQAKRFRFKNKESLLMNIVENDNTYYVDIANNYSKYIVKYLEEHSGRTIVFNTIKKGKEYSIYKVSYGD